MNEITSYQTKDGKIFEYKEEALIHENELDFLEAINKIVSHDKIYSNIQSEISNFILKHRKKLKEIFRKLNLS